MWDGVTVKGANTAKNLEGQERQSVNSSISISTVNSFAFTIIIFLCIRFH